MGCHDFHGQMDRFVTHAQMADAFGKLEPIALVPCGPCAGTGEYPPTDGDTCPWCDGDGEVPAIASTDSNLPVAQDDNGGSL